jgi:hypothetical protein
MEIKGRVKNIQSDVRVATEISRENKSGSIVINYFNLIGSGKFVYSVFLDLLCSNVKL